MYYDDPKRPAKIFGSPLTKRLEAEMMRLASTPKTTVSIRGELGVGKRTLANRLHLESARRAGPFVALGAGEALSAAVLESAVGGTLYLSDVTSLGADEQEALGALLAGRLDSIAPEPGIRVISAAREDLEQAVAEGRLREDLEYRLNVLTLEISPLRERVEEILDYAWHFLSTFAARLRLGTPDLAPDAESALLGHMWPGNLHELKSVMERSFFGLKGANILITGATLGISGLDDLPMGVDSLSRPASDTLSLEILEEEAVRRALSASAGNRSLAARQLGIHRTTLYHKMRRFGIR
jgi:DNA-binding NtrC family response regulator